MIEFTYEVASVVWCLFCIWTPSIHNYSPFPSQSPQSTLESHHFFNTLQGLGKYPRKHLANTTAHWSDGSWVPGPGLMAPAKWLIHGQKKVFFWAIKQLICLCHSHLERVEAWQFLHRRQLLWKLECPDSISREELWNSFPNYSYTFENWNPHKKNTWRRSWITFQYVKTTIHLQPSPSKSSKCLHWLIDFNPRSRKTASHEGP